MAEEIIDPVDVKLLEAELTAERFMRTTNKGTMRYTLWTLTARPTS